MRQQFLGAVLFWFLALAIVRADQATESIQQKLKDQGFYYGEINGKNDEATTAAIRRYQIRYGLQVTGEINAETQRSLGLTQMPGSAARPAPAPATTPVPERPEWKSRPAPPDEPDYSADSEDDERGPERWTPAQRNVFAGTPFEMAPPHVQQQVIIGAQALLARQGYYRSIVDGVYGPGTAYALRAYQVRMDLPATGALNMETLASMGLLPGQQPPHFWRRRRPFPPPSRIGPTGERVYLPN